MRSKRKLYAQLLFTALAFFLMVILSYAFMKSIVNNSLERNAEGMFAFAESQIESELLELKSMLGNFAQTVRNMILRGAGAGVLRSYLKDMTDYMYTGGLRMPDAHRLFGYFEMSADGPVYINLLRLDLLGDAGPMEWPWYRIAVEAGGDVVEIQPPGGASSRNAAIT